MASRIEIQPVIPFDDGVQAGKELGRRALDQATRALLRGTYLRDTLGGMARADLSRYAMARLETPPDYVRYPELQDLYPEKIDFLRGFAKGAECALADAAVYGYVQYRQEIDHWYRMYQIERHPGHCSGVLLVGPDGVLGGQSVESGPPPKPRTYRWRAPGPYAGLKRLAAEHPRLTLRRPRTGYIEAWGVTNEAGVACCAGKSCGVWLDEPIEDTWPIGSVPLLRFAKTVERLEELYRRYTLHNWGRASQIWADVRGQAIVVEKSYRRIGVRRLAGHALWCSEGHFETPDMNAFIRERRLDYLRRTGKHAGADDMQYANDCSVRFAHIGELCHRPWGRGYEHMHRILTNHDLFPRAVCRHGGPDTDPYDMSVTLESFFLDLTHNRSFRRVWAPWKKFPCQVPAKVTQYPPRPCG
jgi:hypothetical protein